VQLFPDHQARDCPPRRIARETKQFFLAPLLLDDCIDRRNFNRAYRKITVFSPADQAFGGAMLTLGVENIGDIAVVACKGTIVRSDAALKLRNAVTSQRDVRIVVIDLSEVRAIEGVALGTLWFLQRWSEDHRIQLKLYNPTGSVRDRLEHNHSRLRFEIATWAEMMSLLTQTDERYARAA
jgi:anti-anti-sigma regulatory factor